MKKRPLDKSGLLCYNNVVYYYVRIMIRRKTMFKLNSEQKEFLTKLEEKFRETIQSIYTGGGYADIVELKYSFDDEEFTDFITLSIHYGVYNPENESLNFSKSVELDFEDGMSEDFIAGMFYQHLVT